jgi:hypothetical protein
VRRAFVIGALGALLAGCSGGSVVDFTIELELAGRWCGDLTSCEDWGMGCGAVIQVRILPAEPPTTQPDGGGAVDPPYSERCIGIRPTGPDDDLCGLDRATMQFTDLSPGMARIQVAVWDPGTLGWNPDSTNLATTTLDLCPPGDVFDRWGRPMEILGLAFGGARYFELGAEPVALISLECADFRPLAECLPPATSVEVTVDDIETTVFVPEAQAADLTVSAGKPRSQQNAAGEQEWVIDGTGTSPPGTFPLPLDSQAVPPLWHGEVATTFEQTACVQVLDGGAQATTSATCYQAPDEAGAPLSMVGHLVPKTTLDQVLAAADITGGFPAEGLVIGRVVDHLGAPLAGVQVTAAPDYPVRYLNDDRDGLTDDVTSSSGYFVAETAPFNTRFTAIHTGDLRAENGEYRAGLILGKLSVVVIEMEPPI